jgi:peptidoglycan/LPS O-acetylase OafA/YrhL
MSNSNKVLYLDGWRGLAITFLLIGHFFPVNGINLGAAGVNLFFVLSGFLMARLLFVDHVPIPDFYRRRGSRVFPAAFCFLIIVVVGYMQMGFAISWPELAAAAAFVINYFPGEPGAAVMPFGHIWSLCVEEHSYVLLSIVAIGVRKRWFRAGVAVGTLAALFGAVGVFYWLTYRGQHLEFDRWIHSEVSAFGIFAAAAIFLVVQGRTVPKLPFPVIPALIAIGFALHWWSVPAPVRTMFGLGAFALAINLLNGAPALIQRLLSLGPLRQLGLWSFSIYLWQQPFYLYVNRQGMSPVIGVCLSVLAGMASFYLLENPARNYLNRKWGRANAVPLADAAVARKAA